MFGVSWLRQPKDLVRATSRVKSLASHLEHELSLSLPPLKLESERILEMGATSVSPKTGSDVIEKMDDFSNELCKVLDASEVVRSAHVDEEWRREAARARRELSLLTHRLNSNTIMAEALQRIKECNLSREERRIRRNLVAEMTVDDAKVIELKESLNGLSDSFIRNLWSENQLPKVGGGLALTPPVCSYLLRTAEDEMLRKEVYFKALKSPKENKIHVEEIISKRRELALLTGSNSFAEHTLRVNSLAKCPETVITFLTELSEKIRPTAREEYDSLLDFSGKAVLEPWDLSFYQQRAKENLSGHIDESSLWESFSLEACLRGIELVVTEIFDGVECRVSQVDPEASWCEGLWKVSIIEDGTELGTIYLDLFSRENKAQQSAHFVVQCSRNKSEGDFQEAIVVLLCSFSGKRNGGNTLYLFPSEVKTLFHEFGHAIHSVFSSSKYHYLSGTRGEIDFIEVPSTLFEKFAFHPSCLERYAAGVNLPALQTWLRGQVSFKALDMQRQLALALSDQVIHNDQDHRLPGSEASEVFVQQMEEHTFVPHKRGTWPELRFQHLVLYPAYYYSYLWAQCISESLWHDLFHENPLDRQGGKALRNLLSKSAREDPKHILENMGEGKGYVVSVEAGGAIPKLPRNLNPFL